DTIKIGLVGCGGRGTGAAIQALTADYNTRLTAVADVFDGKVESLVKNLQRSKVANQVALAPENLFVGLDGYQKVIDSGVEVVLLATPPGFRPLHLRAAIDAGKHVFAEKPVAVDAPGVRSVLESVRIAKEKNLYIVSGLHGRYEPPLQQMVERIHNGDIGEILSMRVTRYGGRVWIRPREEGMTDLEYQLHNWYYFTWLGGDFIVEQFVHEMDRMAWVIGQYPREVIGTGGRQARLGLNQGHIYDHFSPLFTFANGVDLNISARHQSGCANTFTMNVIGTEGRCTGEGKTLFQITGKKPWVSLKDRREKTPDGHQVEHDVFFRSLRAGRYINNGEYMAKSTLMSIMARDAAYTGQRITWEQAMNSTHDYMPDDITPDNKLPEWTVPIPGVTPFA
ncbi:MAG: Gfo/Idh/MocA family protein, partial [Planctomycetota bacterium]